jgi:hypothetical protein
LIFVTQSNCFYFVNVRLEPNLQKLKQNQSVARAATPQSRPRQKRRLEVPRTVICRKNAIAANGLRAKTRQFTGRAHGAVHRGQICSPHRAARPILFSSAAAGAGVHPTQ